MILYKLKKKLKAILSGRSDRELTVDEKIKSYITNGRIAWEEGYNEYKHEQINSNINDEIVLASIKAKRLPDDFGYRLDERIIEYAWIFSKLSNNPEKILDAGSTFNFEYVVDHSKISKKDLSIFTYSPEKDAFYDRRISYLYGDLRDLPFKEKYFDTVVSQSTIEHIDMDNSIYGYDIGHNEEEELKSYEYLKAVKEMEKVLKPRGTLLVTFPFGKFENHGFFQQFDKEMTERLLEVLDEKGIVTTTFFKYESDGWKFAQNDELASMESFNPHTGRGKSDDGAAHCRSVCCIEFIKAAE